MPAGDVCLIATVDTGTIALHACSAMQLRHKKCTSVIQDHKWPLADGVASPHMDSVVPVKKAKLHQKDAIDAVSIPLHQCNYEVCNHSYWQCLELVAKY